MRAPLKALVMIVGLGLCSTKCKTSSDLKMERAPMTPDYKTLDTVVDLPDQLEGIEPDWKGIPMKSSYLNHQISSTPPTT